jgi:Sec-independent protein translocase protein TatA
MKKSERVSRAVLIFIVVVALLAVGLQLINEKTNLVEKTYEIVTFAVALTAVIMAVLQGIVNARTTRNLEKIIREVRELMNDVERNEKRELALKREIKKDLEIDQRELEMIAKRQK